MRKIISLTIVFVLLITVASFAGSSDETLQAIKKLEEFTVFVMTKRQEGASLVDMLDRLNDIPGDDDLKIAFGSIIIDAFETPRYDSERMKQRAIEDFANKWTLAIIEAIGEEE